MTRIMVLGGTGMLGHKMFQVLGARFPETTCTISGSGLVPSLERTGIFQERRTMQGVDALCWERVEEVLKKNRPEVVVNCIGVIKQRDAAGDVIPSITLNSLLPHKLAALCAAWDGRVIHFSTDCVFSGRQGGYTETSPSDAEDLYGKSKFLGEVRADNALTLRTSIIGHELKNFASLLEWFLAQNGKTVSGYRRVIYSGVTTIHLARVVGDLIADHQDLSGLYQVTGRAISKYDLLGKIRDAYALDIQIEPEDTTVSDRSMMGEPFEEATGLVTPSWEELVADLAQEYPQYATWRLGR
jgi:dTDP-4-dehydrorhamnose reductase